MFANSEYTNATEEALLKASPKWSEAEEMLVSVAYISRLLGPVRRKGAYENGKRGDDFIGAQTWARWSAELRGGAKFSGTAVP